MDDQRTEREDDSSNEVSSILRARSKAKASAERAQRLLQDAHDQLIIAKAGAKSDRDPAFLEAFENWRIASAAYSNALDEYTRLLGPT